jgi:hypothetical protein
MASAIDISALTLNPEEAQAVNEAVFEQVYVKGNLDLYHYIQTGVQMQQQIPIFGLMPMLGKLSTGCTPNSTTGLVASEKQWNPKLIDFRLPHCQSDISQLFKLWKRSRQALGTWEDVDNEMLAFIADRAIDAHKEAILRISSFGDTAALNVAGGGVITDGVAVAFFTMLDGLWKQIFTGVAATTVYRHEITENGGASYAAQLALGDTAALDAFRAMYENIDPRAFDAGNLKFQVTRTLWNNWQALLEDKSLANAVFMKVEDGVTKQSYRGVEILPRYDWDRQIMANMDNGTTYNLPHRAILAPVENIPIGTSDEESMAQIDSFYDKVTKQWYFDGASNFDVKLLEEHNIAVAY